MTDEVPLLLERDDFPRLIDALRVAGYRVVGPTPRDGAIVLDDISRDTDLPIGWTDEQDGGHYRLVPSGTPALFDCVVGPHSFKQFLFPPRLLLWRAKRAGAGMTIEAPPPEEPPFAFLGVRPCELAAIERQDRVFGDVDPVYHARRAALFAVVVQCGRPGGTCFCASMETGPRAGGGFDLALTELCEEGRHRFVMQIGTARGAALAAGLALHPAPPEEVAAATRLTEQAAGRMGRRLETDGLRAHLQKQYDNPRWDEVAARCLTCGNCTMVCPTCFCSTVHDVTDLAQEQAERYRTWDSCFGVDYAYIHGGSLRPGASARYRQWFMHKFSTWHDFYGSSGCVGCGRCITWCPVGIDVTEEARALRGEARRTAPRTAAAEDQPDRDDAGTPPAAPMETR